MVLYFSATGNTRFIAEALAGLLEDESLDLLDRIKRRDASEISSRRPFVICAPTYVCQMPRFLAAYLRSVPLTGSRDVYFIFTSGGYAGISGALAASLVRRKGMAYRGCAEFTMPRNYIASDAYPELDTAQIERRIADSADRLPAVAGTIQSGGILKSRHVWAFEKLAAIPFNPVWCRFKQPVKAFHADERCVSCGQCERLCPLNVIRIEGGRPVWEGKRCAHCMSCIQNCPVEAIEYGDVTRGKRRYLFRKYRGAVPVRQGRNDNA